MKISRVQSTNAARQPIKKEPSESQQQTRSRANEKRSSAILPSRRSNVGGAQTAGRTRRSSTTQVPTDRRRTRQSLDVQPPEVTRSQSPKKPEASAKASTIEAKDATAAKKSVTSSLKANVARLPPAAQRITASELLKRKQSPLMLLMRQCSSTDNRPSNAAAAQDDDDTDDEDMTEGDEYVGVGSDDAALQKSPKPSRSPFANTMIKVPRKHMPPLYLPPKPSLTRTGGLTTDTALPPAVKPPSSLQSAARKLVQRARGRTGAKQLSEAERSELTRQEYDALTEDQKSRVRVLLTFKAAMR